MPTCHKCHCYIGGPVKGRRQRVPDSHPPEFIDEHRRPAMCLRLGSLREQILEENAQGKGSIDKARRQPAPGLGVRLYELAFPEGHKDAVRAYGPARRVAGTAAGSPRRGLRLSGMWGGIIGAIAGTLGAGQRPDKTEIVYSGEAGGPRRTGVPRRGVPAPRNRGRRGRGRMKGRRG